MGTFILHDKVSTMGFERLLTQGLSLVTDFQTLSLTLTVYDIVVVNGGGYAHLSMRVD